jgi:hypothetical protein
VRAVMAARRPTRGGAGSILEPAPDLPVADFSLTEMERTRPEVSDRYPTCYFWAAVR